MLPTQNFNGIFFQLSTCFLNEILTILISQNFKAEDRVIKILISVVKEESKEYVIEQQAFLGRDLSSINY